MFITKRKLKIIALAVLLSWGFETQAQIDEIENQMAWYSFSVSKKLNKKWSVSYSQLNSMALDELEFNFIQSNFKVSRKLAKYTYLKFGYKPTFKLNATDENPQWLFHRLYTELQYTQKAGDFRFQHKLGGEHHFTPVAKFQQRYYYSLKTYYRNKDLPLELRPYITQKLMYYRGGNPIPVDDDDEIIFIRPNGLHAYRLQAGVRVTPMDRLNVSLYYMRQFEFNAPFFGGEELNVTNAMTGKTAAPFYNFGVIGISLSYRL
jgi:hypothetical protein